MAREAVATTTALARRWPAMLGRLQIKASPSELERLLAAYGERHRAYHTAVHIEHCLQELDATRHLAREPAEVECALWFHDAIYRPYSIGNEERSAEWARRFLAELAVDAERIHRIQALILATQHTGEPTTPDGQLMIDIDLSILGAEPEEYARFEQAVRREYRWVPGPWYRRKRAALLESFLARPHVYHTDHYRARLERRARRNLEYAVATLRGR